MTLLLIAQKIWRYKLVTLPVLALVLVGAVYVVAVKAPVYEASSTYILVNPPAPPSDSAIARDPKLGHIVADNPYTRYADQSVVVQVLAGRLSSEGARRELATKGADPTYTVAPSAQFGYSAPILEITGTGSSAAGAVRTADIVGLALTRELNQMQRAQRVDRKYRIVTQQVVAPHDARLKASGTLRALVAVLALGAIMLFVVVSLAEAVNLLRSNGPSEPAGNRFLGAAIPLDPHGAEQDPGRGVRPRWAARR